MPCFQIQPSPRGETGRQYITAQDAIALATIAAVINLGKAHYAFKYCRFHISISHARMITRRAQSEEYYACYR